MAGRNCASGTCRKEGTRKCAKCTSVSYCSRACQRAHWKKHKLVCSSPVPMPPGIFKFLDLPREIRNRIYKELLVAQFTAKQQAEYDRLVASHFTDYAPFVRKELIDELEERLMISPGSACWGVKDFKPLVDSHGLLFANKQISKEVTDTLYSENVFHVNVGIGRGFRFPGQMFARKVDPASTAKINHLAITVQAKYDICREDLPEAVAASRYTHEVNALKRNMNHVVEALNASGNDLKSLKVRYISFYEGDVQNIRRAVDVLYTNPPNARAVEMLRPDGKYDNLGPDDIKRLYAGAFAVGDAIASLTIPVADFQIRGDLPSEVMQRLQRKFGVTPEPEETEGLIDPETGQWLDCMAFSGIPGMEGIFAREPVRSPRVQDLRKEILLAPPAFLHRGIPIR